MFMDYHKVKDMLRIFALQQYPNTDETGFNIGYPQSQIHVSDVSTHLVKNLSDTRLITPRFKDWFYDMITREESVRIGDFKFKFNSIILHPAELFEKAVIKLDSGGRRQFRIDSSTRFMISKNGEMFIHSTKFFDLIRQKVSTFEAMRTIGIFREGVIEGWIKVTENGRELEILQRDMYGTNTFIKTLDGIIISNSCIVGDCISKPFETFKDIKQMYQKKLEEALTRYRNSVIVREGYIRNLREKLRYCREFFGTQDEYNGYVKLQREWKTVKKRFSDHIAYMKNDIQEVMETPKSKLLTKLNRAFTKGLNIDLETSRYSIPSFDLLHSCKGNAGYESYVDCPVKEPPFSLKERMFGRNYDYNTLWEQAWSREHVSKNDQFLAKVFPELWEIGVIYHVDIDIGLRPLMIIFSDLKKYHPVYDAISVLKKLVDLRNLSKWPSFKKRLETLILNNYYKPERFVNLIIDLHYNLIEITDYKGFNARFEKIVKNYSKEDLTGISESVKLMTLNEVVKQGLIT